MLHHALAAYLRGALLGGWIQAGGVAISISIHKHLWIGRTQIWVSRQVR